MKRVIKKYFGNFLDKFPVDPKKGVTKIFSNFLEYKELALFFSKYFLP